MSSASQKAEADKKRASQNAEFNMHFIDEKTALTAQGLVLKHVDKIEIIRPLMEARVVARLYSWPICRIIRRDFNLLSNKIFFRVLGADKEDKKIVRDLIAEIMLQSELVKCEIRDNPEMNIPMELYEQNIPLRLVSPETTFLYRALTNADDSIAKLTNAYKREIVSSDEYRLVAQPLVDAYSDLKQFVIFNEIGASDMTASELGVASGIL